MAAGHGGQVLLDGTTAGLLSGIDLIALGPRRLRDIAKPVEVFQVLAVGLGSEFPPLATLDATPGNLRPPTTSFIGRAAELAEVQEALKAHRLVTLTGVGGVGKTRLATEVAARLPDEFPDGVWFFELAAVGDPAAVPDAAAAVLGITQQPGKSLADSVAAALEGRVRLLVFDNCEHVRDAAADLVEAILAGSATVRVLATSREGLGVADEQLWLVPSLEVRAGIDSAAVTLFVERARSVASRFSVATAEEAAAVVEICRRLDGIPLAIELAASRMASMTAREVRDRLDQRFRLLVGSRRGLERHHTLRHAVAWSYDHLDDGEKSLLERCAVFAGGFDLQSACAIGGFDGSDTGSIPVSRTTFDLQVCSFRDPPGPVRDLTSFRGQKWPHRSLSCLRRSSRGENLCRERERHRRVDPSPEGSYHDWAATGIRHTYSSRNHPVLKIGVDSSRNASPRTLWK
jgi:NB-ARC domain